MVRANSELVLDVGSCGVENTPEGREVIITPSRKALFDQLLDYLRTKPDPTEPLSGSFVGREGVAAAAMTLRWGLT
jgi:hypothetical protein